MNPLTRLLGLSLLSLAIVSCRGVDQPLASQPSIVLSSPTPAANSAPLDATSTIKPIGSMLTGRAAHAATLLETGQVLITGGFNQGDNAYIAGAELYDPATGQFVVTGRMAAKRCCHTATRLPNGRVLIAGGFDGSYLASAELYDPATGQFTPTGSLTTPRMDHMAVLLDTGQVLLVGGVGTGWTFLASAELYDPATGVFTPTGSMTVARESHTLTKLRDGRVLITGGHQGRHAALVVYDSAEIYDPPTGRFTPAGHLTLRRHKHDAVLLADGRVLITGGSDERDDLNAYASAELYDPSTGAFSPAGDMPAIRYKHIGTSVRLPDGRVLIAGGARQAVIYDPLRGAFSSVPGDLGSAALSRLFTTATLLPNGQVLITGGYGIGQPVSAQAWLYIPSPVTP
jgi:hypothetical protein